VSSARNVSGIRTRVLLQIAVALILAANMALSLVIVRSRLRQHVRAILHEDLQHSLETFQDLQQTRRASLERENGLLAALPTLRSLMTSHDIGTIQQGAQDFWKLSGDELFALADAEGRVIAANAVGAPNRTELHDELQAVLNQPIKHYLLACGNLYEYSITPIYFGSHASGKLLGYVIGGYAVDHKLLQEVGRGAGAGAIFLVNSKVTVSTLPKEQIGGFAKRASGRVTAFGTMVMIGTERYLAVGRDLSGEADVPLQLVVLKSVDNASRSEQEIRKIVLLTSLLAIMVGSALMLLLARTVTAPLERLAAGVKAFASGDREYSLPSGGPREVRYLSAVLADMRDEIQKKNRALLESERLATIGRMASSVSHDLRHYLAAVYANAEFLASPSLPASERAELFEEIRLAVIGTTDMLDSLLLFGSTGSALRRVSISMTAVVERAVALVRTHPDAEGVAVTFDPGEDDTTAELDTRQIERAVYNLLLNACQSAGESNDLREVSVSIQAESNTVSVTVRDSGAGVPDSIQHNLFDPFVSRGKQKGTGLGLTLAHSVAREHNGDVELLSSLPGNTVFRLTIERGITVENTLKKQQSLVTTWLL
jgi:signal transduction histidine kinase